MAGMNEEILGSVRRALAVEEAMEQRIIELQKQIITLRNELVRIQRLVSGVVTEEVDKKVKEEVEDKFVAVAKAFAGSEWKNLTSGQRDALVEAIHDVVDAYKEKRKVRPLTVQVLGRFIKKKRKTLFNMVLLNLPVDWIVEKGSPTLRAVLYTMMKKNKLIAFKGGTLKLRNASMSNRTFEKLTQPKAMSKVRTQIRNIVEPFMKNRKTLADL